MPMSKPGGALKSSFARRQSQMSRNFEYFFSAQKGGGHGIFSRRTAPTRPMLTSSFKKASCFVGSVRKVSSR